MFASGLQFLKVSCSRFADLVFPPTCATCSVDLDELPTLVVAGKTFPLNVCYLCLKGLSPTYNQKCLTCGAGIEIPSMAKSTVENSVLSCPFCRRNRFRFQRCFSLGNYELGLRDSVLKMKSGSRDSQTKALAQLLASKIEGSYDLIAPIPIHWSRRLGRVSVASEILAVWISKWMRVPCTVKLLRYKRRTQKQGRLSTTDRIMNVKNALQVVSPRKLAGRRILLVDDVMTSCATLNEAANVCLKSNAASVDVAIVARGVGRSMNRSKQTQ